MSSGLPCAARAGSARRRSVAASQWTMGARTCTRISSWQARGRMKSVTAAIRTRYPPNRPRLRRFFLTCFNDSSHHADAYGGDRHDGDPRGAEPGKVEAIGERSDEEYDTDHVDKEISHDQGDAPDMP